jgi:methionyl-tRNA synthetase
MPEKKSYFVTTAIDYVNGDPHLGHAYEKVLADVMARYQRLAGREVRFITGVDEHGQKVQQSAQREQTDPQAFCDRMAGRFQKLQDVLGNSYDAWVRTTGPAHQEYVRVSLQQLKDKGEIVFQQRDGWYSVRQEQFVTEKDREPSGGWPEIFGQVERMSESNYFFRLAPYQDWLRRHIEENPDWIFPAFRSKEVLGALKEPLPDLCISRPKSRLAWGIPLPFDAEYVTFVWFDALLNYASYARTPERDWWPADAHVIGKDIMIPAHAVYWPIMLKALELPLPRRLVVHGWWLNRGAKMSKTVGNIINPYPYFEKFGVDALRYFLLAEMVPGQDADFTDQRLLERYEGDLAKGLGNFLQRSLTMINKYRTGIVPHYAEAQVGEAETELRSNAAVEKFQAAMENWQMKEALEVSLSLVSQADKYIEVTSPFKLAKDPSQQDRLDAVLGHLAETARRLAILVSPVMPEVARRMEEQLLLPGGSRRLEDARFGATLGGHAIGSPKALFPPVELAPDEAAA